jgi:uncharacterized NAD(P)/FAD-binding protein YdhS
VKPPFGDRCARSVTIVGGGYSGASMAIQLARRSASPLAITVVEPRPHVGYGLAYSSDDLDHRLNGAAGTHLVDPMDPEEFTRWCAHEAIERNDPEAVAPCGTLFVRRRDFGRFVARAFQDVCRDPTGRARLRHVQDQAVDVIATPQSVVVTTRGGARLSSDLLVVATGNSPSRFPAAVATELATHPGIIGEPADLERIRAIDKAARVLLVGTGLTALDVMTTLVRGGHEGAITSVSPRGLRPRPHRGTSDTPAGAAGSSMLQHIDGPVAPFIRGVPSPITGRMLVKALRQRIGEASGQGESWYGPFDEFRDPLWQVWSQLDVREKKRLLRHVRRWYDVHRFRAPPQNEAIVREAEQRKRITFRAARVRSIAPGSTHATLRVDLLDSIERATRTETFDAIVNCAGLDNASGVTSNPLLASLARQGLLQPDPTGIGFAVDRQCRPLGTTGTRCERLRVIGPPTAGVFGDPLGTIFIAAQIRRILPGILSQPY